MVGYRLICILLTGLAAPAPDADPESNPVIRIDRWIEGAARVDWSRQGDWLAYDKAERTAATTSTSPPRTSWPSAV